MYWARLSNCPQTKSIKWYCGGRRLRHWRAHWCNLFGCVPVPQNLLAFGAARRCMRSPKPPAYLALPIAAPPRDSVLDAPDKAE